MPAKKIFIFYHPGSYGSWLRWMLEYGNDLGHRVYNIVSNPIEVDGSSHLGSINIAGNHPPNKYDALSASRDELAGYSIWRLLPITMPEEPDVSIVLDYFYKHKEDFDKIIYVDPIDDISRELLAINLDNKTDFWGKLKGFDHLITAWNPNETSFHNLETWEKREFISYFYKDMGDSMAKTSMPFPPDTLIIPMLDILDSDPIPLLNKMLEHCKLPKRPNVDEHIKNIHQLMLANQTCLQQHANMKSALSACLEGLDIPIEPMGLMAEGILQYKLRQHGHEIKCYKLNTFPATTKELMSLFIKY